MFSWADSKGKISLPIKSGWHGHLGRDFAGFKPVPPNTEENNKTSVKNNGSLYNTGAAPIKSGSI